MLQHFLKILLESGGQCCAETQNKLNCEVKRLNDPVLIKNRDLKQPGRRAKWTPTGSVLTKPATSAHVSDVVYMAFRTSNV